MRKEKGRETDQTTRRKPLVIHLRDTGNATATTTATATTATTAAAAATAAMRLQ